MKYGTIGIFLGLFVIATSNQAHAQSPRDLKDYSHIYDVKAICGPNEKGEIIAPGHYWTAINILNSGRESVKVSAWVSVGLPGLQPGLTNGTADGGLDPGQTLEVDCPTIRKLADSKWVKGYIVLGSTGPITVVAVYTQSTLEGMATSMHTERVVRRSSKR